MNNRDKAVCKRAGKAKQTAAGVLNFQDVRGRNTELGKTSPEKYIGELSGGGGAGCLARGLKLWLGEPVGIGMVMRIWSGRGAAVIPR